MMLLQHIVAHCIDDTHETFSLTGIGSFITLVTFCPLLTKMGASRTSAHAGPCRTVSYRP